MKKSMGCLCRNEDGSLRMRRANGTCCLCCFESSRESYREEERTRCFDCRRGNYGEDTLRKKRKCSIGCFSCNETSKEEESSAKTNGNNWLCCKNSSEGESSRKGGKCGLGCFCCKKTQAAEDSAIERGKCRMRFLCCNNRSKEEGLCCFCCKNSSEGKLSRKGGKCGVDCFCCKKTQAEEDSARKRAKCTNRSKEEESTVNGVKRGGCCFFCKGSSKVEDSSAKRRKCGMSCFRCNKSSSEETTRRKGWCSCCFCRNKSSKEEVSGGGQQKAKGCFHCCKPLKVGCPSCRKWTRNEESKRSGETMTCCCKKQPRESDSCSIRANKKKKKNKSSTRLCWRKRKPKKANNLASLINGISFKSDSKKHRSAAEEILRIGIGNGNNAAQVFKLRELEAATQNFSNECLLGQGGFGRVYKGQLQGTEGTDQIVAVKQLDREGYQGNREFLIEVLMLSLLNHHNLVTLLGYCVERDERILVYDYMPLGSLEDHLHDLSPNRMPLDWKTRMKIAAGAAKGLEYLHDIANPPVIYRDLKTSNILLDEDFIPKLSDFGLAKLGPVGDQKHVSTRVMGTYGYCAPEYARTGKLTKMSDVYCFGIVLLELITGRKPMDKRRPWNEQLLVEWAAPLVNDKKRFTEVADPLLKGNFPMKSLYQALAIVSLCLRDNASTRPVIRDIVTAIEFLARPDCNITHVDSEGSTRTLFSAESEIQRCASGISEGHISRQQSGCDWRSCSTTSGDKIEPDIGMT